MSFIPWPRAPEKRKPSPGAAGNGPILEQRQPFLDTPISSVLQETCGIVFLQVVSPASAVLAKTLRKTQTGWQIFEAANRPYRVQAHESPLTCFTDLADVLADAGDSPKRCAIRGAIRPECSETAQSVQGVRRKLHVQGQAGEPWAFESRARRWVACDLDSFKLPVFVDPIRDIEHVIDAAVAQLPPAFADASFFWQLTSGHGIKPGGRARLWFWLSRATTDQELKRWLSSAKIDCALFAPTQPTYTAAPILPAGEPDLLPVRSGVRHGWADFVQVPPPEVLATRKAFHTGTSGGGGDFVAPDVAAALARMGDRPAYPSGLGFHAPVRAALIAAIRSGGPNLDADALLAAIDAALSERGHTREAGYIESRKSDARTFLAWFLARAGERHETEQASATDGPHYPRPTLHGDAASLRLRRVVRAYFDRVERQLDARDWIAAEATRIQPEVLTDLESRLTAKLIKAGVNPEDAASAAADRAEKACKRVAKQRARRRAVVLFGARPVKGDAPAIQIAGAAGLGKTQAFIEEYLRRPSLWTRNFSFYTRDLRLADNLAGDFAKELARQAADMAPVDGVRPNIKVIRGRQSPGMCHPERLKVVAAAIAADVSSVYRAVCHSPALGDAPESFCPHFGTCKVSGYVSQFSDEPALRIMAHARLVLNQPGDLRLPAPDAVIVDESAIGTFVAQAVVDLATITTLGTYAAKPGDEHRVQEAADVGREVLAAIQAAPEGAVGRLRMVAWLTPEILRAAADAAALEAEQAKPILWPGMNAEAAKARCKTAVKHPGKRVAALMGQLARDWEQGRESSIAVEHDAQNTARLEDGTEVPHPVIRVHGCQSPVGALPGAALILLDADAVLDANRAMFRRPQLRSFTIRAVRTAHVIQISDAALGVSTLAPGERFVTVRAFGTTGKALPTNHDKAAKLRGRIAVMVAREASGSRKVLVVCAKAVRLALAGEENTADLPYSTKWQGADLTHFGRHLGVNDYASHDTVIILGRLQLPPVEAERQARALYGNAPGFTLELPKTYTTEMRRHDLRDGTTDAVRVQVHIDARVQALAEIGRENAMGQGIDRLRLIHGTPERKVRVLVFSNLPVPGLVVDELMTSEDMLEGGTIWQRAMARRGGGVLLLVAKWLHDTMPDLFTSERNAERALADFGSASWHKRYLLPSGGTKTHARASYRTRLRGTPSAAFVPVEGGRAALEAVVGPLAFYALASEAVSATQPEPGPVPQEAEPPTARVPVPVVVLPWQADLFGFGDVAVPDVAAVVWLGGLIPEAVVRTARFQANRLGIKQDNLADEIGISRPQLANILQGRFGASPATATRIIEQLHILAARL